MYNITSYLSKTCENTVKYHSMPTKVAKIPKGDNTGVDKDVEQPMLSHTAGENVKWHTHFG